MKTRILSGAVLAIGLAVGSLAWAQTEDLPEDFKAVAVVNNNLGSGVGRIDMRITRWSTDEESERLSKALREKGADAMLEELQDMKEVGFIRTPDSLAYDLHYAYQIKDADGGRQIVIATDRPIGFWEAANRPITIDYPFTVVQMRIGPDGKGDGTLSYAAKIEATPKAIVLEHFATSPVMLTEIEATVRGN